MLLDFHLPCLCQSGFKRSEQAIDPVAGKYRICSILFGSLAARRSRVATSSPRLAKHGHGVRQKSKKQEMSETCKGITGLADASLMALAVRSTPAAGQEDKSWRGQNLSP
eukprot:TRINITY_DN95862_c0_g1_i1.p4 TRINITY_DN95862_c0_g1~~TRINITY_DN95862_c0_g1_i1.p4  ORF type:complete len:110 (-),score=11.28 TRINITY_DN95862_c0_g1_i1:3-332(-)